LGYPVIEENSVPPIKRGGPKLLPVENCMDFFREGALLSVLNNASSEECTHPMGSGKLKAELHLLGLIEFTDWYKCQAEKDCIFRANKP
jgi:hypothetical protein